jgi:hypothetical protein
MTQTINAPRYKYCLYIVAITTNAMHLFDVSMPKEETNQNCMDFSSLNVI